MATSGKYSFALDRDTIIKRAMQLANITNLNQAARGDDLAFAVDIFQSMIKLWQAEGIQLWNRRQGTIFPSYQGAQYGVSSTGSPSANTYVDTTLSAAEALGQTILTVQSSTGMNVADAVGIELDDSSRQWTTIVSVDSSTQITVTDSLTAAAGAGNTLVAYTKKIADRPLRILDMRTVDLDNDKNSVSMEIIGYNDYFNIPVKTTDGRPLNFYYDKLLDEGQVYVFPRPNNVNFLLEFTYHEAIEDVDSGTDSLDFPTEWTLPLIYGLAAELCVSYGKFTELPVIDGKAQMYKAIVRDFDNDEAPFYILPESNQRDHG